MIERRSFDVFFVNLMIDDGPVYHAKSVHFRRAKSITRFGDRYAEAQFFKSGVLEKLQKEVPLFL